MVCRGLLRPSTMRVPRPAQSAKTTACDSRNLLPLKGKRQSSMWGNFVPASASRVETRNKSSVAAFRVRRLVADMHLIRFGLCEAGQFRLARFGQPPPPEHAPRSIASEGKQPTPLERNARGQKWGPYSPGIRAEGTPRLPACPCSNNFDPYPLCPQICYGEPEP